MCKQRTIGGLAISAKVLRNSSGDCHGNPDNAVLVDSDPGDVEPRQAALGTLQRPALATATESEPVHRPHPILDGVHIAEEVLLLM